MSKNLPKPKTSYQNYLSINNNCKVLTTGSKPLPHLNPENILTDNIREVWLSNQLPAICIIDMRNAIQRPVYFNKIGFNCWHEYESNPKLIEIQYTGQDNPENAVWVVLTKIRLQLSSGWQHFKIPLLLAKNILFLKVKIMQNHSESPSDQQDPQQAAESNTYLNQISLGYVEDIIQSRVQITAANTITREKTFSDFRKNPSLEKQLKKLSQKVKHLTNQNQAMKRTIDQQNSVILKLQDAVHNLAENVARLQQIQSSQQYKIMRLQKTNPKIKDKTPPIHYKQKLQQFFNDESQIIPSHEQQPKSRQKQKVASRHHSIYEQNSSQLSKHNSIYKSNKGKSNHNSNNSKKHFIYPHIDESDNNSSEYDGTTNERVYPKNSEREKKSGKDKEKTYIPMLEKLQELILLRDQKKNKLKTHKKSRRPQNIIVSSNDQEDYSDQ